MSEAVWPCQIVAASDGLLTLIEILALAMLTSGIATNLSKYAKSKADSMEEDEQPTLKSLTRVFSEFLSTVAFLCAFPNKPVHAFAHTLSLSTPLPTSSRGAQIGYHRRPIGSKARESRDHVTLCAIGSGNLHRLCRAPRSERLAAVDAPDKGGVNWADTRRGRHHYIQKNTRSRSLCV